MGWARLCAAAVVVDRLLLAVSVQMQSEARFDLQHDKVAVSSRDTVD